MEPFRDRGVEPRPGMTSGSGAETPATEGIGPVGPRRARADGGATAEGEPTAGSAATDPPGTAAGRAADGPAGDVTVEVRCTGHVRRAVGAGRLSFVFEGRTLRDFLEAFFAEYDVRGMIIAMTEAEATAPGWAPAPARLPGKWRKNPEGDQTRPFARVVVNGTFNEHLRGLDTVLHDGDRVALMYPFVFCV